LTAQEVDYSKAEDVSEQGVKLFKVMMRLEFALKDIGYGACGWRQAAEVNWDRYAKEKLGLAFWQKISAAPEVEVLIQAPPKRQIIDQDGHLDWEQSAAVSCIQDLVGAIRRVRNNLFHGGKSGDPDADRNTRLYAAALFVVDQILREDDALQTSFSGRY
jgi:hypothetical protein